MNITERGSIGIDFIVSILFVLVLFVIGIFWLQTTINVIENNNQNLKEVIDLADKIVKTHEKGLAELDNAKLRVKQGVLVPKEVVGSDILKIIEKNRKVDLENKWNKDCLLAERFVLINDQKSKLVVGKCNE